MKRMITKNRCAIVLLLSALLASNEDSFHWGYAPVGDNSIGESTQGTADGYQAGGPITSDQSRQFAQNILRPSPYDRVGTSSQARDEQQQQNSNAYPNIRWNPAQSKTKDASSDIIVLGTPVRTVKPQYPMNTSESDEEIQVVGHYINSHSGLNNSTSNLDDSLRPLNESSQGFGQYLGSLNASATGNSLYSWQGGPGPSTSTAECNPITEAMQVGNSMPELPNQRPPTYLVTKKLIELIFYRMKRPVCCEESAFSGHLNLLCRCLELWNTQLKNNQRVDVLNTLSVAELVLIESITSPNPAKFTELRGAIHSLFSKIDISSYSNFDFLYVLFRGRLCNVTRQQFETRLTPIFLSTLSTDQVIDIMVCLLNPGLNNLTKDDIRCIMEILFGSIDCFPNKKVTADNIYRIISLIFTAKHYECFECVYLTWRMWGVVEIARMMPLLNQLDANVPRKTFIMMYLFSIDMDDEGAVALIAQAIERYESMYLTSIREDEARLTRMIDDPRKNSSALDVVLNNFPGALLYLPKILQNRGDDHYAKIYRLISIVESRYRFKYTLNVLYALQRHAGSRNSTGQALTLEEFKKKLFLLPPPGFELRPSQVGEPSEVESEDEICLNAIDSLMGSLGKLRMIIQDEDFSPEAFKTIITCQSRQTLGNVLAQMSIFVLAKDGAFGYGCPDYRNVSRHALVLRNIYDRTESGSKEAYDEYVKRSAFIELLYTKLYEVQPSRNTFLLKYMLFHPDMMLVKEHMGESIERVMMKYEKDSDMLVQILRDWLWCSCYRNEATTTIKPCKYLRDAKLLESTRRKVALLLTSDLNLDIKYIRIRENEMF